tara:strand:+ start:417 stop:671 length:255 start_codon:yes stop_codon:yes gene_type:complete
MTTKYVIIDASEVSSVDFSQVCEDSADTVRYNLDNSKALVKFDGSTPSFLNGKTQYTHTEIRSILTDEAQGWHIADTQAYLDSL